MYDKRVFRTEEEAEQAEREAEDAHFRELDRRLAEQQFQEWCKHRGHDPEDVGSMRGYEEWYAWEHGADFKSFTQPEEQP